MLLRPGLADLKLGGTVGAELLTLFDRLSAGRTLQRLPRAGGYEKTNAEACEDYAHSSEYYGKHEEPKVVTRVKTDVIRVCGIVTNRVASSGSVGIGHAFHFRIT